MTLADPPLLGLRDVQVRYGRIEALRGVSLRVERGEFVALVGPNGAGKSTLVNTVSGLLRPVAGTITLDGQRIDRLSPAAILRRGVAQVPEGRQVFAGLTVEDNLALGAFGRFFRSPFLLDGPFRLARGRRSLTEGVERVYALFPRLRDLRSRNAGTLSGGEQQMLALGRALMSDTRLLVIDELSLGLAPIVVGEIADHLRQLHAAGLAVLLVEQNVNLAFALASRVYVLERGQVWAEGSSDELRARPEIRRVYLGGTHDETDDVGDESTVPVAAATAPQPVAAED